MTLSHQNVAKLDDQTMQLMQERKNPILNNKVLPVNLEQSKGNRVIKSKCPSAQGLSQITISQTKHDFLRKVQQKSSNPDQFKKQRKSYIDNMIHPKIILGNEPKNLRRSKTVDKDYFRKSISLIKKSKAKKKWVESNTDQNNFNSRKNSYVNYYDSCFIEDNKKNFTNGKNNLLDEVKKIDFNKSKLDYITYPIEENQSISNKIEPDENSDNIIKTEKQQKPDKDVVQNTSLNQDKEQNDLAKYQCRDSEEFEKNHECNIDDVVPVRSSFIQYYTYKFDTIESKSEDE